MSAITLTKRQARIAELLRRSSELRVRLMQLEAEADICKGNYDTNFALALVDRIVGGQPPAELMRAIERLRDVAGQKAQVEAELWRVRQELHDLTGCTGTSIEAEARTQLGRELLDAC